VDHVKTRLDFSKDSESGSSKAAAGAAPGGWQTAAEELGEELGEEFRGPGGQRKPSDLAASQKTRR
jgi:hypothetical protein